MTLSLQKLQKLHWLLSQQLAFCKLGNYSKAQEYFDSIENCLKQKTQASQQQDTVVYRELKKKCLLLNDVILSHLRTEKELLAMEYIRCQVDKELIRLQLVTKPK